jgi:hypothetical protein
MSDTQRGKTSKKIAAEGSPEPVTEAEREHGAGKFGRLAGPRPPDRSQEVETPIMGLVPPDPNMPDEVGDMDFTRGDATRVREQPRGSAKTDGELIADETRRRELYREGATEVSEG